MQLNEAVRRGRIEVVRHAIAEGTDLNQLSPQDSMTPLMVAAEQGWAEIVALLLQSGADVNVRDRDSHTALTHAVAGKKSETVRQLIAAGAELNVVGTCFPYNTPLMFAAMSGRGSLAKLLVEAGADVDAADPHGNTALMKACQAGKPKTVRCLLRLGADPNRVNEGGRTAIFCAVQRPESVNLLLGAGADPNHADHEGYTPLLAAATLRKSPCVQTLLAAGAGPNARTYAGASPLWAAVRQRLAPPVRWLLAAGATPNDVWPEYDSLDNQLIKGTTPLMYAAATGRANIVRLLLDAGADPALTNDRGQTALLVAAANNHPEVADLLMAAGGTLGEADRRQLANGRLLRAARRGDLDLARRAVQDGAQLDYPDPDFQSLGMTPLMHASAAGHAAVVRELLAAGADPNRVETTNDFVGAGLGSLHQAALGGHAECVRALVAAQTDVNASNQRGETPLMLAAEKGWLAAVDALIAGGADLDLRPPRPDDGTESAGNTDEATVADAVGDEDTNDEGGADETPPFSAIERAAHRGHRDVVLTLLRAGARDRVGALLAACQGLGDDVVRQLLDAGVKPVSAGSKHGDRTPLHAVGQFRTEVEVSLSGSQLTSCKRTESWLVELAEKQRAIATMLLAAGADPDARDCGERTPLHAAVLNETYQTVKSSKDAGVELHQGHEVDPTGLVRVLLEAGADPNAADRRGCTPLMLSAARDPFMGPFFPGVVQALVRAGAHLNAQDRRGRTALMQACRQRQSLAVSSFLELGAEVRRADAAGRTALHWAVKSGADAKLVRQLLDAGADPNAADRDGRTAMDEARDQHARQTVKLLQKAGAADTARPIEDFCRAVEEGHPDAAQRLLEPGLDLHRLVGGRSAWLAAIRSNDTGLIRRLLDRGADIHARLLPPSRYQRSEEAESALHLAALYGSEEVVALLLQHGADPRRADRRGRTPVTCAAMARRYEVLDRLQAAGGVLDPLAAIYLDLRDFPQRAEQPAFHQAVNLLTQLCHAPPRQLDALPAVRYWSVEARTEKEQRLREDASAHAFAAEYQVLQEKVDGIIAEARRQLAASPCLVLDLCTGIGCATAQFIGLFPTGNPLSAVAAIGTASGNDNLSNADLLQFLLEMQQTNPFELLACRHDTLKIRFLQELQQAERLARDMYRICSDIIHQGYGSMDELLKALREERRVTFWWD